MFETLTLIKILAGIGILDTVYLVVTWVRKKDVACLGFPNHWCRKVQYSTYAKTFGIPNSVAGFVMYSGILLLAVLQPDVSFRLLAGVVGVGFVFSMYFLFVQVFVLRALCTWCMISIINFSLMFWAVFLR